MSENFIFCDYAIHSYGRYSTAKAVISEMHTKHALPFFSVFNLQATPCVCLYFSVISFSRLLQLGKALVYTYNIGLCRMNDAGAQAKI